MLKKDRVDPVGNTVNLLVTSFKLNFLSLENVDPFTVPDILSQSNTSHQSLRSFQVLFQ